MTHNVSGHNALSHLLNTTRNERSDSAAGRAVDRPLVSTSKHMICQPIECRSILLREVAVKRSEVGSEIGEFGRTWDGDNVTPFVQHPSQGDLRC